MEAVGKNLLINTAGKKDLKSGKVTKFESDLLKSNKNIALQSCGVYRCLFGGGQVW